MLDLHAGRCHVSKQQILKVFSKIILSNGHVELDNFNEPD